MLRCKEYICVYSSNAWSIWLNLSFAQRRKAGRDSEPVLSPEFQYCVIMTDLSGTELEKRLAQADEARHGGQNDGTEVIFASFDSEPFLGPLGLLW